ncbi:MAG TPA: D-glycerate dehydrogenase [bacterium]|nr:D-glycerate dehydrogenase [bacterium]
MPKPRIYLTQPIPEGALARLRSLGPVEMFGDPLTIAPRDRVLAGVREADVLFCLLHDRIDAEVLGAGERLRLVACMAIIPANIDLGTATARGIPVTVIPPLVTEATADVNMGLLLAVARRIVEGDRLLRAGVFPGSQSTHLVGGTVHGKTIGIVGLGAIGREVAKRARGFGMRVLYMKRRRLPESEERALGIEWAPLDDLLRASDFVSVNALFTSETRHLIGEREMGLMKPTAYLINTSRGPLVDEAALARALRERRIAGAGLDVYEHEPKVTPELLEMPNVVLTPHVGSADRDTRERIAGVVVDNIEAWLRGDRPPNVANPEIYTR